MKNTISQFSKIFMVVVSIVLVYAIRTSAAPSLIQIAGIKNLPTYIGDARVPYKMLSDNTPIYCLDMSKKTPINVEAKLQGECDAGITYIIANGYPNKSFKNNQDMDYYITQTAIWWYLDITTGSSNLSHSFKTDASDANGLRPIIKELVAGAQQAKNIGYQQPSIKIGTNDITLNLKDNYYISDDIYVEKAVNINSYTVTATGIDGIEIIDLNGNVKNTFNPQEKFRIRVKAAKLTNPTANIVVKASASTTIYKAYSYQPTNPVLQPVTVSKLEAENVSTMVELNLKIDSTKLRVVKIDKNTGKPLPGATLVLKDASGKELTSWVSTNNYHVIRNLNAGTYTVEETQAPQGYILNKQPVKFIIDEQNREITIKIENKPRISVVNILKIDKSTGKPLPGAVLVVKDASGKEIAKFTSTTTPYVLTNLANGKYSVEEVSAPTGYMFNNERIEFEITDEKLSYQIEFENYPEVIVPDTASSSLIYIIIGSVILTLGFSFIYNNAKEN